MTQTNHEPPNPRLWGWFRRMNTETSPFSPAKIHSKALHTYIRTYIHTYSRYERAHGSLLLRTGLNWESCPSALAFAHARCRAYTLLEWNGMGIVRCSTAAWYASDLLLIVLFFYHYLSVYLVLGVLLPSTHSSDISSIHPSVHGNCSGWDVGSIRERQRQREARAVYINLPPLLF